MSVPAPSPDEGDILVSDKEILAEQNRARCGGTPIYPSSLEAEAGGSL